MFVGKVFCHGVLYLSSYVLTPAHCLAAGKKLRNYKMVIRTINGTLINLKRVNDPNVVHPEFRLVSYNKKHMLHKDIALVKVFQQKSKQAIYLPPKAQQSKFSNNVYRTVNSFVCSTMGLENDKYCLIKHKTNGKETSFMLGK